jgi:hypothetical protein
MLAEHKSLRTTKEQWDESLGIKRGGSGMDMNLGKELMWRRHSEGRENCFMFWSYIMRGKGNEQ